MPVRIPAAKATEVMSFGVAGVGAFAPIYMMLAPGAEETMARHTGYWAPRWEHVAQRYISPPMQHAVRTHVSPPVERTMQRMDKATNHHMTRAAQHVDRRIRNSIQRVQK
ncbi:hypothetical protein SPBR_03361 [Sporothrix brasiliensis 5110]|uniref:4-coumarate:coenzyme A ligase n=1 Tax=Sporothrix brasiliensis 5110 TaxID=1398154 RepID=A0A0C2IU34_9PEZI|nr:uncharacterized protein SPBR_03361 [Sporothrix brasiliensis 5110]KIH92621.1 hypothetical protein SPBR_03361 [Sporothrix brasiliensis 5110]